MAIYLDYAAATPLNPEVLKAMNKYSSKSYANPSAITYASGREASQTLSKARTEIASYFGAKSTEIILTAGGSEANNLAVQGVLNNFKNAEVVTIPIEHPSVSEPVKKYAHKFCLVDNQGLVDLKSLEKSIGSKTVLVSIAMVNHEIGTIQPIKQISDLINKIRLDRKKKGNKLPLYLHSDACQATNYLDLHVSRLGVDLMTINGAKIYGPKQCGLLFIKTGVVLSPLIFGGGQERGLRSGTENVANAIGLAKALEVNSRLKKTEIKRVENLRDQFIRDLIKIRPDIKINGSTSKRVANNVHLTIPGIDNEWLLIKLDQADIEAAAGSACSASNQTPSEVLKAIGLDEKSARESIRFSLGRQTKMSDINRCLSVLSKLIS